MELARAGCDIVAFDNNIEAAPGKHQVGCDGGAQRGDEALVCLHKDV